jgi:hypothetical protein
MAFVGPVRLIHTVIKMQKYQYSETPFKASFGASGYEQ